jgi:cellulose synthase/poly-beta-1,6-N-acetylglucosamine synthase-like glycosyltransferase
MTLWKRRLMLKENWQVWFAHELEGSYEEAPQGLIENAQRDRRWCQGNLQHGMVLFAKGLRGRKPDSSRAGNLWVPERTIVAGVFADVQLDPVDGSVE